MVAPPCTVVVVDPEPDDLFPLLSDMIKMSGDDK